MVRGCLRVRAPEVVRPAQLSIVSPDLDVLEGSEHCPSGRTQRHTSNEAGDTYFLGLLWNTYDVASIISTGQRIL